jgi:hypothetical protein
LINNLKKYGQVKVNSQKEITFLEMDTKDGEEYQITLVVRKLCDNDRSLYTVSSMIPVGAGVAYLFDGFSTAVVGFPIIKDQLNKLLVMPDTVADHEKSVIEDCSSYTINIDSGYLVLASSTVGFNKICAKRFKEFHQQNIKNYEILYDKIDQNILIFSVEPGTYQINYYSEDKIQEMILSTDLDEEVDWDDYKGGYLIEKVTSI